MDKTVKLLAVNTGSEDLILEKLELPANDREKIKTTILDSLNRMGKQSHVLIKYDGELWVAKHTADRGPSSEYFRVPIRYHPKAALLA